MKLLDTTGELNCKGSSRLYFHTNLWMSLAEKKHGMIILVAISMSLQARNDQDQKLS